MILMIVSIALFLVTMDLGILFVALPSLSADLLATASQKLWIINAYTLAVAGLLPVFGPLGDRFGHRSVFLWGLTIFGVASAVCAFAPTAPLLIAARSLLAVGAALMLPASVSIIRITFTDHAERAVAIGVWSAVASGGAAIGPLLGGYLLEDYWWGSVFLVNVPVVIVGLVVGTALISKSQERTHRPIEVQSAFLAVAGIVGPTYMLNELTQPGGNTAIALVVGCIGVFALITFIRRQLSCEDPLVDLRLFNNPHFTAGIVGGFAVLVSLSSFELVLVQRVQYVDGASPLWSSLYVLPIALASFFAGPMAGKLISKYDNAKVLWISMLAMGLGIWGAVVMIADYSFVVMLLPLSLAGFGLGAAMSASANLVINNAPIEKIGAASSLQNLSYQIGHGLGIGILGSLISVIYSDSFNFPSGGLAEEAEEGIDRALKLASDLEPSLKEALVVSAQEAFHSAYVGVASLSGLVIVIAALVIIVMVCRAKIAPARPPSW